MSCRFLDHKKQLEILTFPDGLPASIINFCRWINAEGHVEIEAAYSTMVCDQLKTNLIAKENISSRSREKEDVEG